MLPGSLGRNLVVCSPEWSPDGGTIVYVRVPVLYDFPRTTRVTSAAGDLYSAPAGGGDGAAG